MKYDLHIHTKRSPCSNLKPELVLKIAKKKKLDGIAVTDHNTIKGSLDVLKLNKDKNFEVIPSAEIRTNYGDVLAYYIQEEIKNRELFKVIDEVRKQGGLISIAHPFRTIPWLRFRYPLEKLKGKIDAIEAFNSRMLIGENSKAARVAEKLNIAKTGGSDGHFWFDIGRAYTIFKDDLKRAIKNRKTTVEGNILLAPVGGSCSFVERRVLSHIQRR
jgi:predicted metal-dependent phosphoesterase TrpH